MQSSQSGQKRPMETIKENEQPSENGLFTFGEHLEILRKMLFRIIAVVIVLASIIFYFKKETFSILLAPQHYDFCTFRLIEHLAHSLGWNFHFDEYNIPLISTELSAQFMTHITVSCVLAVLLASPYIVFGMNLEYTLIISKLNHHDKRYVPIQTHITSSISAY